MKIEQIQPGRTYQGGTSGGQWRTVEQVAPLLKTGLIYVTYRVIKGYAKTSRGIVLLKNFSAWAKKDVTEEAMA